MESIDPHDKYLDPPDEERTAECEMCGERHDLSDMQKVDIWDDVWVCDLIGKTCLDEYISTHPISIDGDE